MAGISAEARFNFNGVVSTDKTVFQNMKDLCRAAGSWLTYDVNTGRWCVVINKAGASVASFNDSNIIGAITVTGTGIQSLYNSVQVEFPHLDINDQHDFIVDRLPQQDRFNFEPDSPLNLQFDIINNPVHAEYLGLLELKQSRVDKLIKFKTDFSKIGLKAGDIIDVTSGMYGFIYKKFRIVTIVEAESDAGGIDLAITAMEYDDNVYSMDDLYRYQRTNQNGLVTLGYIGKPDTPQCYKYEIDARPRVVVETTIPGAGSAAAGVIEWVEFFYTKDVPPAVTVDSNRTYTQIAKVYSKPGSVFQFGDTVSCELIGDVPQFLVKCRAGNGSTAGPFSDPSGFVQDYTPVQSTDNISQTTMTVDSAGDAWTALPLDNIIQKNDEYFGGNANISFATQNFNTLGSNSAFYSKTYGSGYGITGTGAEMNVYDQSSSSFPLINMTANTNYTFFKFYPSTKPLRSPVTGEVIFQYNIRINTSFIATDYYIMTCDVLINNTSDGQIDRVVQGYFSQVGTQFAFQAVKTVNQGDYVTLRVVIYPYQNQAVQLELDASLLTKKQFS